MRKITFYTNLLLFLVILVSLINLIFQMSGYKFLIEFLIFVGIFVLGFIGIMLTYSNIRVGYVLITIVTAVALLNFVMIYFRTEVMTTVMFAAIVSAMTAFVINVINITGSRVKKVKKVKRAIRKTAVKKTTAVKKIHTPGKYLSSKTGKTYHAPNCDWAKRIKGNNRVWWETEDKAKRAKLNKHSCLD